jgi:hypothetical protein
MDDREFFEQAEALVRRLMPRVPQKYVGGFEGTLAGGEHAMVIEDLVYIVVDDKVPLSAEERDLLYRLVQAMYQNEELLAMLEGLQSDPADDRPTAD